MESNSDMKQGTRDNLIYLAVGLTVGGLVVLDFFYADSHGREMWWPSNFEAHLVGYMLVLGYFIATEARKAGATVAQIVIFEVAGSVLYAGVAFGFRRTYAGPLSLPLFGLAVLEYFAMVRLVIYAVRQLRSDRG